MPCDPDELRHVPLFELLDDDEARVLATRVEIRRFSPRQRIFKAGDPAEHGYVVMSGKASVAMMDEDQQEVVVDEPTHGDFFGFASMLQQTDAPDDGYCDGRDDLPGGRPRRHCRAADEQADGGYGHADQCRRGNSTPRRSWCRPE